jgi:hypothetical protein
MSRLSPRPRHFLPLLALLLAGCGRGAVVSGRVTYDGRPVENGFITFFPADGRGNTTGAEIVQGLYHIDRVPPGKKRILVRAAPRPVTVPATRDDREHVRLVPPEAPIPADAEGNNQVVEIAPGKQSLDLSLKRPR